MILQVKNHLLYQKQNCGKRRLYYEKRNKKEFVVGKDYTDEFVELHKGDIVQILPIEFFDETDSDYRDMLINNDLDPSIHVDVTFYTVEEFKKIFSTKGQFKEIYSTPVCVYDLPVCFQILVLRLKT